MNNPVILITLIISGTIIVPIIFWELVRVKEPSPQEEDLKRDFLEKFKGATPDEVGFIDQHLYYSTSVYLTLQSLIQEFPEIEPFIHRYITICPLCGMEHFQHKAGCEFHGGCGSDISKQAGVQHG